jgi:cysteinyl-tRNA synthetase
MPLRLYDTFTRSKREFVPLEPPLVRMYNCGPTVYGRPHIGNLRAFLFADLLRRWLELSGFQVEQARTSSRPRRAANPWTPGRSPSATPRNSSRT